MNRVINKLSLILVLMATFSVSEAKTFTIKHNSCSSAPMAYEVLRSKKPLKVTNYTYNSKDAYIESGTVNALSRKQIKLEDSNGKVQVIITKNAANDGKYQFIEYFFNQKTFCVIAEDKKCYQVPEEIFYSDHFGIQTICSNQIKRPASSPATQAVVPSKEHGKVDSKVLGGTPLTLVYESKIAATN